jgi:NADH:ubiquinone oxidoreductase subunit 3 (subunit A)
MSLTGVALHAIVVVLVVATMIGLLALLGERHRGPASGEPYESGTPATGSAPSPNPVPSYLVVLLVGLGVAPAPLQAAIRLAVAATP